MCNCIDVKIQSYANEVIINDLPLHMLEYRTKNESIDSICVDRCIEPEIRELWSLGITTTWCCCGHNKMQALVGVIDSDIPKMKELGYIVWENPCRIGDENSFYSKLIK